MIDTHTKLTVAGYKTGRPIAAGSSLFVSIGSTIGKVGQLKSDGITNQQINALQPSDSTDTDFVFSLLQRNADGLRRISATQAVPILNKTSFSKYRVYIPHLAEQEYIGVILRLMDDAIALHQRVS